MGRKRDFPLKKEKKKDSNFTNVDLNSAVIRDKKRKIEEMGTYPSDLDELAVSGGAKIRVRKGIEEERNGSISWIPEQESGDEWWDAEEEHEEESVVNCNEEECEDAQSHREEA